MVDLTSKIAASTEAARRQMGREVWGGGGGGVGRGPYPCTLKLTPWEEGPQWLMIFFFGGGRWGEGILELIIM